MTTWDTGEQRYHRRKRIRGPLTLLVLLGMLVGAAWFGWQTIDGEEPATVQTCRTPDAEGRQRIATSEIVVNVYNAGDVRGLGGSTAEKLENRGFEIGDIANDPEDAKVKKVEIRGRAKNAPEVQLLAEQVAGEEFVADERTDQVVDLVLGNGFKGLVKDAPSEMTVQSPLTTCVTSSPTPKD